MTMGFIRRVSRSVVLAAAAVAVPLGVASAQQPAVYARAAGDTVRFHQISTGQLRLAAPGGAVAAGTEHDAVVAVAFVGGDTARAWYEALTVGTTSPHGVQRPGTAAALRQPFTLRFDANGHVETLAAPTFPADVRDVGDLAHQFDDFFLRLPAAPLAIGATWVDTVTRSDSAADGSTYQATAVTRHRVERDTIVNGIRALVVSAQQEQRVSSRRPVAGQPETALSQLSGTGEGVDVFAPSSGRLLGRRRTGELRGVLTMTGEGNPNVRITQVLSYQNTIEPADR